MSAGEAFTNLQRQEIERAISEADRLSGRLFSVHVGHVDGDTRRAAEALHARLASPDVSVLIHVDPVVRALEIVTGSAVRRHLNNRKVALAAIAMQSAFATGDLSRGLLAGLQQLAHMARPVQTLHGDTP